MIQLVIGWTCDSSLPQICLLNTDAVNAVAVLFNALGVIAGLLLAVCVSIGFAAFWGWRS